LVHAAALAPVEFFGGLRKGVKSKLPPELRGCQTGRGHSRLLKLHYGRPEVHFEAWHHTGAGRLELGLHFEGPATFNQAALDFFRPRMVEIKASLPRAELEPWDRGWSRLYETLAAPQLDEPVQRSAIERFTVYITTLQPLVTVFLNDRNV
jgi:hypothetical protein